jgi:hypothetical protein
MIKQIFKFTIYSQNNLEEDMADFKEQILKRDDVSYANVCTVSDDETDMTYPEEAEENPEDFEDLTGEELLQQDFVDNTIMNIIYKLLADFNGTADEEYNGELVGDIRDLIINHYNLPREFYPYLRKKEAM